MSYEIGFKGFNTPSITVSNDRGEKVKELWFMGKKETPIDIDGNAYLVGQIKSVVHVPDPPVIDPFQTQLPEQTASRCKAQYSIQLEIMRVAKEVSLKKSDDNPTAAPWSKLLQDRKWKEAMRLKLHEMPGVMWCDDKSGDCACDPAKPGKGMDAVKEIFGTVAK